MKYNTDKIEKIGRYPSSLVDDSIKNKNEYGLSYCKAMYYEWAGKTGAKYDERKRKFMKSRRYAEGLQDVSKYKDLLDAQGDTSYLNLDWSQVAIIPKFVDVVVGGILNQDYDIKCTAIDPIAQDQKRKDQNKLIAKMMAAPQIRKMEEMSGIPLMGEQQPMESMEEVELHMSLNYKQQYEIAIENGVNFVMNKNEFDETKKRVVRDLVSLNTGAVKVYTDPEHGVKVNYVDPINLVTSYSNHPDYRDIQHAGEIVQMSISELKRIAGDNFTEDEYEKIAKKYSGKYNNPTTFNSNYLYDPSTESYSYSYDDFTISVFDFEFLSTNKMKFEKKENIFGGATFNKKPTNYKQPKNSKTERELIEKDIKVVYQGKWVIDTDYVFNYKMAENMIRPKSNLPETKLSYKIYSPNLYRMNNKSMVERMMPFADQIQLSHYKIQQLIAKARPKGLMIEVGGLEGVMKGDGGEMTPLELQAVYDQTGNYYYRRQADDGAQTNFPPIQELENGLSRDVIQFINIYNHNLQMIRDVTGVNEVRDASQPSSEALVGVQKLALLASNNATRYINDAFLNIVRNTAEDSLLRIQDILEFDKPMKGYVSALGSANMKVIELNKEISLHEFGLFIEVAPDAEQRAMLEQNIQISLGQKELRLEDAISIREIKNTKLANRMLNIRRKKYMQEQQMIAQQNAQMNAQAQQQSAAQAAQIKQQEFAMQAQADGAKLGTAQKLEMEKMQMEFQLKEQFEQRQHQRRLEELQMSSGTKKQTETEKENRKDKRIDKAAHNQSKMIEQRKGRSGTIPNPEDEMPMPKFMK